MASWKSRPTSSICTALTVKRGLRRHWPYSRWLVFCSAEHSGVSVIVLVIVRQDGRVSLGRAPRQADLLRSTVGYCRGRVAPDSIYGVLQRECFAMFPDEMFSDLFTDVGRRSVPPMIVAVVMVLQRIEGLSDREAVERFCFDARSEVRRRRPGFRLPRVRAHRVGGHAGQVGPFGVAGPDVPGHTGGGAAGRVGGAAAGAGLHPVV